MADWAEPANINIVLTAWYLKHANTGSNGQHTAGNQCTWVPTKECTFTLEYSTSLTGSWTKAQIYEGLGNPINPSAPLTGAVVAVTNPLFIRVTAAPTLKYTRISSHDVPHTSTDPATGKPKVTWENKIDRKEGYYWGGTAYFQYNTHGNWGAVQPTPTPAAGDENISAADLKAIDAQERACVNFGAPSSLLSSSPVHTVTTLIPFMLSTVRLATRRCMVASNVQTWQEQSPTQSLPFIASDAITNGHVNWTQATLNLDSRDEVVQVTGVKVNGVEDPTFGAPRLLAVHWPKENDPTTLFPLRAPETEFLIFFHAALAQNRAVYASSAYPYGNFYVAHSFNSYLGAGSFEDSPYPLAIPYSLKEAGKKTVLILPMNRKVGVTPELPELNFGDQCQCLLEEIHCLMLRAKPVVPRAGENLFGLLFFDPNIGRIGCGSFSAGVTQLLEFKRGADRHAYLKTKVQEYYLFDPKHGNGQLCGQYALNLKNSWAGSDPNRRVGVYNNQTSDQHAQFLGLSSSPPSEPYLKRSTDGRFTAGVINDLQMQHARDRLYHLSPDAAWSGNWGLTYHPNFVRTFLVDAMRNSGFK